MISGKRILAALFAATQSVLVMSGCLFDRKGELDHPSVCGHVYEEGSEKTISDAIVRVHFCHKLGSPSGDRLEVKTDASGYFYLSSRNCMGVFSYELNISKTGYDSLYVVDEDSRADLFDDCSEHDYFLEKQN